MDEPVYDPTAYRAVFEGHFTYIAGFQRNLHRFSQKVAFHDPATGRALTYAELGREVDHLARAFQAAGVGPGDVVTYQLPNELEFVLVYLATQTCGAVGSPINFRLSNGETAHVLDDSRPVAFVYDAEHEATATGALHLAEHRPAMVLRVGEGGDGSAVPFDELLGTGAGAPPVRELARSIYDETTRLYTSGTTGLPKGVPLCSVAEVLSAHDVIMHFPLAPDDRTLNMTPWFHRGGLHSGGPCPALYVGAEIVPLRRFDAPTVLDLVERLGLTYLIGAPTTLAMLADGQEKSPRDLGTLRGIVTMGAPLGRDACLRYQRVLTPRIFNGYGTTEAFWNTFLRPSDLPAHAGSAGRACTDDDVVVVRRGPDGPEGPGSPAAKDGRELGEVAVRSPKASYAYANNPTEEAANFRDGWLYIGDLATWDEDEHVTIVGRSDDMIISGGENVHPVQVEEVLDQHPGVAGSCVVGLADEQWSQVIVAYVVRRDPAVSATDLERHCRDHPMLATYKRPRAYCFVDDLPVTATGKKMHFPLREQAAADAADGRMERPAPVTAE
ncbi:MAG: class I adenylate-forming enzyme family protein [Acidimicrobiales bacterium]